jgi:hypothetical protein
LLLRRYPIIRRVEFGSGKGRHGTNREVWYKTPARYWILHIVNARLQYVKKLSSYRNRAFTLAV